MGLPSLLDMWCLLVVISAHTKPDCTESDDLLVFGAPGGLRGDCDKVHMSNNYTYRYNTRGLNAKARPSECTQLSCMRRVQASSCIEAAYQHTPTTARQSDRPSLGTSRSKQTSAYLVVEIETDHSGCTVKAYDIRTCRTIVRRLESIDPTYRRPTEEPRT